MKMGARRIISLLILIVSILTIFAPLRISILPPARTQCIVHLNVCSHGHGGLSVNSHAPYLVAVSGTSTGPELSGTVESTLFVLNLPIIIHSEEKPPRV